MPLIPKRLTVCDNQSNLRLTSTRHPLQSRVVCSSHQLLFLLVDTQHHRCPLRSFHSRETQALWSQHYDAEILTFCRHTPMRSRHWRVEYRLRSSPHVRNARTKRTAPIIASLVLKADQTKTPRVFMRYLLLASRKPTPHVLPLPYSRRNSHSLTPIARRHTFVFGRGAFHLMRPRHARETERESCLGRACATFERFCTVATLYSYLLCLRLRALDSHLLQQQLCPLFFCLNLLHLQLQIVP